MTLWLRKAAATLVLSLTCATSASAGPTLLFESATGKVIYAEDADNLWYPASLTKVMTAYLTFEALKAGRLSLDTKIGCSLAANLQPPSKIGLPVGGEITVDTALKALIVKSANDVAVMLAEALAGSEGAFVAQMNATAVRLGMSSTRFVNPNGLPASDQVTTARDLAKLARAITTEYPEYAHYWSLQDVRIGAQRMGSHNGLLKSFPGADGLKTGFTCDSGFNVIASATRDGRQLMAVVLGESSGGERTLRAASLLEHGFQNYDWKSALLNQDLDTLPVPHGARTIVSMRETVLAWDCGTRKPRRANNRKKAAKKAAPAAAGQVVPAAAPTAAAPAAAKPATP